MFVDIGVEEHEVITSDERNVTISVNIALVLRPVSARPLLSPIDQLKPTLKAISESIDDALCVFLDRNTLPLVVNQAMLSLLPTISHPPIVPFGPRLGNSEHCAEEIGSIATISSPAEISRFYACNWLNTWVQEDERKKIWDIRQKMFNGELPTDVTVHREHILMTRDGPRMVQATARMIVSPETNKPLFSFHIIHINGAIIKDSRVQELTEVIESELGSGDA